MCRCAAMMDWKPCCGRPTRRWTVATCRRAERYRRRSSRRPRVCATRNTKPRPCCAWRIATACCRITGVRTGPANARRIPSNWMGDTSGEVMALTTHAIVSVTLGRNEEALEAALLSVRLSQFLENDEYSVLSYNALGVAYFWSHGFDKAEQALDTAVQIAAQASPPLSIFQPRVNQWWTDLLRVFHERYFVGELPALDGLRRRARGHHRAALPAAMPATSSPGTHITTEAVLQFGLCLEQMLAWPNRSGPARCRSAGAMGAALRHRDLAVRRWRAGCAPRSPGRSRLAGGHAAGRAHDRHRGAGRTRATGLPGPPAVVTDVCGAGLQRRGGR